MAYNCKKRNYGADSRRKCIALMDTYRSNRTLRKLKRALSCYLSVFGDGCYFTVYYYSRSSNLCIIIDTEAAIWLRNRDEEERLLVDTDPLSIGPWIMLCPFPDQLACDETQAWGWKGHLPAVVLTSTRRSPVLFGPVSFYILYIRIACLHSDDHHQYLRFFKRWLYSPCTLLR